MINKWQEETELLRKIVLKCGLDEVIKWGQPCYVVDNKNIVLIHGFKEYCALLFLKGALMDDPDKILIQQTENVQAGRQIRFTNIDEIKKLEPILKKYIKEAMGVEKEGLKIVHKQTAEFEMAEELKNKLKEDNDFKVAFEKLTPGRQRAYILFFLGAKQAKTRIARIEKWTKQIKKGKGLNDQ